MFRTYYILFLFFISSCSAFTSNFFEDLPTPNKFYQRFPENKKSLIVMKYTTDDLYESLLWCKVSNEKERLQNTNSCHKLKALNYNASLMLEPGIYKLITFSYSDDQFVFAKNIKEVLTKKFLVNFEAKQGEIVYVGAIDKKGSRHQVVDEFELFKKSLETANSKDLGILFEGHLQDSEWLIDQYRARPQALVKRLANNGISEKEKEDAKNKKILESLPDGFYEMLLEKVRQENLTKNQLKEEVKKQSRKLKPKKNKH